METTIVGLYGVQGLGLGDIGIMEKKMEATILRFYVI